MTAYLPSDRAAILATTELALSQPANAVQIMTPIAGNILGFGLLTQPDLDAYFLAGWNPTLLQQFHDYVETVPTLALPAMNNVKRNELISLATAAKNEAGGPDYDQRTRDLGAVLVTEFRLPDAIIDRIVQDPNNIVYNIEGITPNVFVSPQSSPTRPGLGPATPGGTPTTPGGTRAVPATPSNQPPSSGVPLPATQTTSTSVMTTTTTASTSPTRAVTQTVSQGGITSSMMYGRRDVWEADLISMLDALKTIAAKSSTGSVKPGKKDTELTTFRKGQQKLRILLASAPWYTLANGEVRRLFSEYESKSPITYEDIIAIQDTIIALTSGGALTLNTFKSKGTRTKKGATEMLLVLSKRPRKPARASDNDILKYDRELVNYSNMMYDAYSGSNNLAQQKTLYIQFSDNIIKLSAMYDKAEGTDAVLAIGDNDIIKAQEAAGGGSEGKTHFSKIFSRSDLAAAKYYQDILLDNLTSAGQYSKRRSQKFPLLVAQQPMIDWINTEKFGPMTDDGTFYPGLFWKPDVPNKDLRAGDRQLIPQANSPPFWQYIAGRCQQIYPEYEKTLGYLADTVGMRNNGTFTQTGILTDGALKSLWQLSFGSYGTHITDDGREYQIITDRFINSADGFPRFGLCDSYKAQNGPGTPVYYYKGSQAMLGAWDRDTTLLYKPVKEARNGKSQPQMTRAGERVNIVQTLINLKVIENVNTFTLRSRIVLKTYLTVKHDDDANYSPVFGIIREAGPIEQSLDPTNAMLVRGKAYRDIDQTTLNQPTVASIRECLRIEAAVLESYREESLKVVASWREVRDLAKAVDDKARKKAEKLAAAAQQSATQ